jgi:hypothetical protein
VKFYEATSTIGADPDTIWKVLTDGAAYPDWDSGVTRVDGDIAPGAKLKLHVAVSPKRAFPVRVTEFVPGQRMRWTGGMPLGLFRGERTFTLAAQPGGDTVFTLREEYTGPMLPLIWRSIPDLGPSFRQFAHGLKERVEHP